MHENQHAAVSAGERVFLMNRYYIYIYTYIPRTQMSSIFEGQPSKTRPFSSKTRVICVLRIYIYIYSPPTNIEYTLDFLKKHIEKY